MKLYSLGSGVLATVLAATLVSAGDVCARELPWRAAGLTQRQAAAHLLDRFAYGPRPGEIDEVVELGLENWLKGQLAGDLRGSVLDAKLSRLPAATLPQQEIVLRYSKAGKVKVVREAVAAGLFSMQDYRGERGERNLRRAMAALERFGASRTMEPAAAVVEQLKAQKLLRAVYSESQLVEVLTDFWFNHFNVSTTSHRARVHVLSYERDAIRPRVLTSFRELLGATARHPAMLHYLGNALSVAPEQATTVFDLEVQELDRLSPGDNPTLRMQLAQYLGWFSRRQAAGPRPGLNENYAREILELHTLGVDGGYRQRDVIEVARAFTGWTTYPPGGARDRVERALVREETAETARDMGFVVEEEFIFRADLHDSDDKSVLGVPLPAGRGIEDGEEVLDMVANHPSTRRRLAEKLAIRFVSEHPSRALIDRLEETWELTGGDLYQLVRALVESPEFWGETALHHKVKSPFELTVSALRALDAEVFDTSDLIRLITRMGQPLYSYSAPTGFPDRADYWSQVGPLLERVNFGQKLAQGNVKGVKVDLLKFLGRRQLDSLEAAVEATFPVLMPERDASLMLAVIAGEPDPEAPAPEETPPAELSPERQAQLARRTATYAAAAVGLLIASPEFQVQ